MGRNDPEGSFFFKSYTDPIRRNGTMEKKRVIIHGFIKVISYVLKSS